MQLRRTAGVRNQFCSGRRWPCSGSSAAVKHSEMSMRALLTFVQLEILQMFTGDTQWRNSRGEKRRGKSSLIIMATECTDFQEIKDTVHSVSSQWKRYLHHYRSSWWLKPVLPVLSGPGRIPSTTSLVSVCKYIQSILIPSRLILTLCHSSSHLIQMQEVAFSDWMRRTVWTTVKLVPLIHDPDPELGFSRVVFNRQPYFRGVSHLQNDCLLTVSIVHLNCCCLFVPIIVPSEDSNVSRFESAVYSFGICHLQESQYTDSRK